MTHLPPEKVAAYVTQSGQALAIAQEQMQKAAEQERSLRTRAPEIADMLLAHNLITPGQKAAALEQLSNPELLQTILCNVLNKQAAAQQAIAATPATQPAGRGITSKAASAFGFSGGHTPSAPGPGEGDGSLFNPIVCGAPRASNDPTMQRWSASLMKLAGIHR